MRFKCKLWKHRVVCRIEKTAHLHGVDAKMAVGALGAYAISKMLNHLFKKNPEALSRDVRMGVAEDGVK